MPNIILLKSPAIHLLPKEGRCGVAITPGMLIEWNAGNLRPHATAAGAVAAKMFAREAEVPDTTLNTHPLDVQYAVNERLQYFTCYAGCEVYALLEDTANVAKGAALESNGAGALQARTTGAIVAYAMEALNNTSGANARLRVEVA
jgi:hypothetical protein